MKPAEWLDWTVVLVLLAVITLLLARRKLLRELPVFSFYVIYHLLYGSYQLVLRLKHAYMLFYYVYWLREGLDILIILAVLHEVFAKILSGYPALRRLGTSVYATATLVFGSVGFWLVWRTAYVGLNAFDNAAASVIRSFHFVELGIVFALLVFCRLFALPWRQAIFGVAIGFGVKSSMQALGQSVWLQSGYPGNMLGDFLVNFAYVVGLLIWTSFLITKQEVEVVQQVPPSQYLERWDSALDEIFAS
ncbi:MAG TPA: hypothetical protein VGL89_03770 [Candidatus Koribacter sp.]|jgi:hypothetical protein